MASLIIPIAIFILDISLFTCILLFQTVLIMISPISETVLQEYWGKNYFPIKAVPQLNLCH